MIDLRALFSVMSQNLISFDEVELFLGQDNLNKINKYSLLLLIELFAVESMFKDYIYGLEHGSNAEDFMANACVYDVLDQITKLINSIEKKLQPPECLPELSYERG